MTQINATDRAISWHHTQDAPSGPLTAMTAGAAPSAMTTGDTPRPGQSCRAPAGGPSLPEVLAALRRPATYPLPPNAVAVRETHMSCVFLTDRFVYKLKKPERLNSLDYTTLDRRRACCEAEVALNRRLAPGVYLGVVPLARAADGGLRVETEGAVVEWLVKMRRLAEARMLDVALAEGTASREDVGRAADLLAGFFRACLRARLCVGHLRDAAPRAPETWLAKARWYLEKARAAAAMLSPPAGR